MSTQRRTVHFYQIATSNDGPTPTKLFQDLVKDFATLSPIKQGPNAFEFRHLDTGRLTVSGAAGKVRLKDLPTVGKLGGQERPLTLEKDEGLLEKSYFVFYQTHAVLGLIESRTAATSKQIGEMLTAFAGSTIALSPILRLDSIERLMRATASVRSLDISIAAPSPQLADANSWNQSLFSLMSNSGAYTLSLRIAGNLRSKKHEHRTLHDKLKGALKSLLKRHSAEIAKARISMEMDDGTVYPIDLVTDRFMEQVEIDTSPDGTANELTSPQVFFDAIQQAYVLHRAEIEAVLAAVD